MFPLRMASANEECVRLDLRDIRNEWDRMNASNIPDEKTESDMENEPMQRIVEEAQAEASYWEFACARYKKLHEALLHKIETGQYVSAANVSDIPLVKMLMDENDELKLMLTVNRPGGNFDNHSNQVVVSNPIITPVSIEQTVENPLLYAEVLRTGKSVVVLDGTTMKDEIKNEVMSKSKPRSFHIDQNQYIIKGSAKVKHFMDEKKLPAHKRNDVYTKFKLVDVGTDDCQFLKTQITTHNRGLDDVCVETIYQIRGPKSHYFNAIIKCNMDQAALIERTSSIKIEHVVIKAYKCVTPRQCTFCWSYHHSKAKCKSKAEKICKKCSSATCDDKTKCKPHCSQCANINAIADHQVGTHHCMSHNNAVNRLKRSGFSGHI